ncbi:MAG: PaeR7I family type II restriction endonuclease [Anaerolineales bacterium]|nr:PaeR7I family type II restriction endonuclease [Anaerolineales bacterium]
MKETPISVKLSEQRSRAVSHYWRVRKHQRERQLQIGREDQGARSAVTGGAQMDGFINLFNQVIIDAGIDEKSIYRDKALYLPGYFRPTKEWDLLVIKDGLLVAVIEAKSQVGPSFGNNFNNRTEEAMGSALDIWTAFRQGAFNKSNQPFLGYFFLLEDCDASQMPVRVREPHFEVFPEFVGSSYAKRYEVFCRKLVLERHYTASSLVLSKRDTGLDGIYKEPATDLTVNLFLRKLGAQVSAYVD